jgi:hypothetical protein
VSALRRGHRPQRRLPSYRLPSRRRPAFHTSPHAEHRQYVAALITLLVVVTSCERQLGQFAGATVTAAGGGALFESGYLIMMLLKDTARRPAAVRRWHRVGIADARPTEPMDSTPKQEHAHHHDGREGCVGETPRAPHEPRGVHFDHAASSATSALPPSRCSWRLKEQTSLAPPMAWTTLNSGEAARPVTGYDIEVVCDLCNRPQHKSTASATRAQRAARP